MNKKVIILWTISVVSMLLAVAYHKLVLFLCFGFILFIITFVCGAYIVVFLDEDYKKIPTKLFLAYYDAQNHRLCFSKHADMRKETSFVGIKWKNLLISAGDEFVSRSISEEFSITRYGLVGRVVIRRSVAEDVKIKKAQSYLQTIA